jgi:hypothetical protein
MSDDLEERLRKIDELEAENRMLAIQLELLKKEIELNIQKHNKKVNKLIDRMYLIHVIANENKGWQEVIETFKRWDE